MMQPSCVCVLLLVVISSSLGTPLAKRLGERLYVVAREEHGSGNVPSTMVLDEHTGVQIMREKHNFAPPLPKSFDWRKKPVISPVKNQGDLSSSFAIVAAECVESQRAIYKGWLVELSSALVQDCCPESTTHNVFQCICNIGGLCSEQVYPVITGHCRNTSCDLQWGIKGGKKVPAKQVMQMTEDLLINPLMVLIDTSQSSFEVYKGGIYNDTNCSNERVDHALQVVGYGEEVGKEYWICKNSWGTAWGEEGYIRILKGSDMCGIESFASYPLSMF